MRFHFWHTALSLFYAALAALAIWWLAGQGDLFYPVPLGDFLLMALAIMRLVRLATYDNITAFVRAWFAECDPHSLLGSFGTLINCPWCTGLWFSLVVVFFYFLTPYAWFAILILALASAASLSQLAANALGWSAEAKKRHAHALDSAVLS
jgi:hypothetical protein